MEEKVRQDLRYVAEGRGPGFGSALPTYMSLGNEGTICLMPLGPRSVEATEVGLKAAGCAR